MVLSFLFSRAPYQQLIDNDDVLMIIETSVFALLCPGVKVEEADALVAENHMLNEAMFWQLRRIMRRDGTITIVTDNSRYAHFLAEQISHMKLPALPRPQSQHEEAEEGEVKAPYAFHTMPASESRFMQTHGVVGGSSFSTCHFLWHR